MRASRLGIETMAYHYITLDIVMRDCKDAEQALREMSKLLPTYPDETTRHMESWSVERIHNEDSTEHYDRSTAEKEEQLEGLLDVVEPTDQELLARIKKDDNAN